MNFHRCLSADVGSRWGQLTFQPLPHSLEVQYRLCLPANDTTASRRNTGSQTQLETLLKNEMVIDMERSTAAAVTSVWFTGMCVCVSTVCACVRSFSVCHAPLPPPVYLAHFLHRLPPRYFMSESFYSSHLRTHFRLLNVSICGGSDTHSLTPQGTYP